MSVLVVAAAVAGAVIITVAGPRWHNTVPSAQREAHEPAVRPGAGPAIRPNHEQGPSVIVREQPVQPQAPPPQEQAPEAQPSPQGQQPPEEQPSAAPAQPGESQPAREGAGGGQPKPVGPGAAEVTELDTITSGEAGVPAMLMLGADWCQPCRKMLRIMDDLQQQYGGSALFVYINTDAHPGVARQYSVGEIPVQVFFDASGEPVFRHVGFYPQESVVRRLAMMGVSAPG